MLFLTRDGEEEVGGGIGARCRAARPWLASPSILSFLSRPTPRHHHPALFSKNPPPLLRPLQAPASSPPHSRSLLLADVPIAPSLILIAKLFLPFFLFGLFISVAPPTSVRLYIYMLYRRAGYGALLQGLQSLQSR